MEFSNSKGYKLSAEIDWPEGQGPFPFVIFSHGFGSSKNSPRTIPIARGLKENSIGSFRFDYTGHGDSEGSEAESTFEQQRNDLETAIGKVEELDMINKQKIALHGASSGALVTLMVAEKRDFKALLLRGPRIDGEYPQVEENINKINTPILAIQGEQDPMLKETERFLDKIGHSTTLAVIKGAGHLFQEPDQYAKVKQLTVSWLISVLLPAEFMIA